MVGENHVKQALILKILKITMLKPRTYDTVAPTCDCMRVQKKFQTSYNQS